MTTQEVADQLVALCSTGENVKAIETLYSDDIVSVEPVAMEGHPKELKGKEAILGKTQWWLDNHEIHDAAIEGPFVGGNQIALLMAIDVTFKPTNQRMQLREMCLYKVADGKIVHEEFFYNAPNA